MQAPEYRGLCCAARDGCLHTKVAPGEHYMVFRKFCIETILQVACEIFFLELLEK